MSVCEVVLVPCVVGAVVALTVMCVLLFVCEGDVNAGVRPVEGMGAGCEYVAGTRGTGVVSSVFYVLLLLFAMIRSVVKSFKVPDVEVAAARMSNESALTRMTDSTPKKPWSDLTLVLDG